MTGDDDLVAAHRQLLRRVDEQEHLIREQAAQLRVIFDRVREYAVYLLAPDGTIASWNASGARLTGLAPDHVIGKPHGVVWVEGEGPDRTHLETAERVGWAEHSGWCRRGDEQRFWAEAVTTIRREGGEAQGFAVVLRDSTDRKSFEERLHHLSITDELTSLPNRRHFLGLLGSVLGAHARYGQHLSLVVVDIDDFKHVNDAFGRLRGDDVLRQIARVVRDQCRAADVAARVSGDRFAVLLPSTHAEQAGRLAERVRRSVEREGIPSGDEKIVTISLGVAEADADDDVTSVFERAERALAEAKRQGRNRVAGAT